MNFYFILSVVAGFSFEFRFPVNQGVEQDYFFLEGLDQNAYLSRVNSTVYLRLSQGLNYSIYSMNVSQPSFQFSWLDFKTNNKSMKHVSSVGETTEYRYENVSFISPEISSVNQCLSTDIEYIFTGNSVNYWYIVLIAVLVGLLVDLKGVGVNFVRDILSSLQRLEQYDLPISTV